ncbi:PD-(D/E)XK motif protein [Bacillus sp. NP157]|nr:PD-(D/E)XK motif protein [Bacillus sp. NP157]
MATIDQRWSELREELTTGIGWSDGDSYRMRLFDQDGQHAIFAAIDGMGRSMLAIGSSAKPQAVYFDTASVDCFRSQRADGTWLLLIRLTDSSLSEVFANLCGDLVDAISQSFDEAQLLDATRSRLELWKRLFDKSAGGMLADFQIQGLIAELLELRSLMLSEVRPRGEILMAWVGPIGADQDFLFSDFSREVKSIRPGAKVVSISSIGQLDVVTGLTLVVYTSRRADPHESGAITLNRLVAEIEDLVGARSVDLAVFKDRLFEVGYVEQASYDEVAYTIVAREEFIVGDDFPRITRASAPRGVATVHYELLLEEIRQITRG